MNQESLRRPLPYAAQGFVRWRVFLAFCAFCVVYLLAIKISVQSTWPDALLSTLANVVPLSLLGLAVRYVVRRYLMVQPMAAQFASHMVLAIVFALLWYWSLMVLLGLQGGHSWTSFQVRPIFDNPAIAWMMFQGITFYSLAVSLTYLEARGSAEQVVVEAAVPADLLRYFVREKDAIRPVDAREIVTIRGAGDYAEVTTENGTHLARRSLADFERLLKADRFIRVHRTTIVNLERIAQAEPAGDGRLLIHMQNGEMIQTSRAGAKLLRAHVI